MLRYFARRSVTEYNARMWVPWHLHQSWKVLHTSWSAYMKTNTDEFVVGESILCMRLLQLSLISRSCEVSSESEEYTTSRTSSSLWAHKCIAYQGHFSLLYLLLTDHSVLRADHFQRPILLTEQEDVFDFHPWRIKKSDFLSGWLWTCWHTVIPVNRGRLYCQGLDIACPNANMIDCLAGCVCASCDLNMSAAPSQSFTRQKPDYIKV